VDVEADEGEPKISLFLHWTPGERKGRNGKASFSRWWKRKISSPGDYHGKVLSAIKWFCDLVASVPRSP
jgi:hypothetical protein